MAIGLSLGGAPDEQTIASVALAAHPLAYVVIANRHFTDPFEWGQRSLPLSLVAAIQHRLLPTSYTLEAGQYLLRRRGVRRRTPRRRHGAVPRLARRTAQTPRGQ
jgi:hypothetical protein